MFNSLEKLSDIPLWRKYEIELFGHGLDSSTPGQVSSISMTRS